MSPTTQPARQLDVELFPLNRCVCTCKDRKYTIEAIMKIYTDKPQMVLGVMLLSFIGGCSDSSSGGEFELGDGKTVTVTKPTLLAESNFVKHKEVVGFVDCHWGARNNSHWLIETGNEKEFLATVVVDEVDSSESTTNTSDTNIYSYDSNCMATSDDASTELYLNVIWSLDCTDTGPDPLLCPNDGYLPLMREVHKVSDKLWEKKSGAIPETDLVSVIIESQAADIYNHDEDLFNNYTEINIGSTLHDNNNAGSTSPLDTNGMDPLPDIKNVMYVVPEINLPQIDSNELKFDYIVSNTVVSVLSALKDKLLIPNSSSSPIKITSSKLSLKCVNEEVCAAEESVGYWSAGHFGDFVIVQVELPTNNNDEGEEKAIGIGIVTTIGEYEEFKFNEIMKLRGGLNYKHIYTDVESQTGNAKRFTVFIKIDENTLSDVKKLVTLGVKYLVKNEGSSDLTPFLESEEIKPNNTILFK